MCSSLDLILQLLIFVHLTKDYQTPLGLSQKPLFKQYPSGEVTSVPYYSLLRYMGTREKHWRHKCAVHAMLKPLSSKRIKLATQDSLGVPSFHSG